MSDALEQELLDLEKQFWTSMKNKDYAGALKLANDPCLVAGPQGVSSIDKKTFEKVMKAGNWTLHDFELRDPKVQRISDDVAIIGYNVHEKLTVDGRPITLDAADASTWVRKNGQWTCVMHTESLFGDPYGRDRKGSSRAA